MVTRHAPRLGDGDYAGGVVSEFIDAEKRTLEMLKVGVYRAVNRELLDDAQFVGRTADTSFMADYVGNTMAVQLRAYVLAEKVHDDFRVLKFDSPASWWQHFKLTYFPRWLLRRRPVRFTTTEKTVHLEAYHGYPDARIALPDEKFGQRVVFAIVNPARDGE